MKFEMNKFENSRLFSYRYLFLALLLLIVASGLLLLPKNNKQQGITPEALLANAISPERYMSSDKLAHIYVNQDPSYVVVDVREKEEFTTYSLPNSINIPLPTLLSDDGMAYLDQNQYDIVFVSNDDFKANQAWILANRYGFKNMHVLKGGLQSWFTTIINPAKPTEQMPAEAFETYSFRKAASMYFGVAYPEEVKIIKKPTVKKAAPKKVVVPKKKKKKMPIEGGC
ncbi:MAG TPA: rhodanese-like domain-containing protein [Flavobacteriaceae bacterium]|nr:rhodanese-like domain-containing protein [Flavobacteriaceae bacterium]